MNIKSSSHYTCHEEWLKDSVGGKDFVLRGISALEFLQLFTGYLSEKYIYVYSKMEVDCDSIKCCVVDSFDGIEYVEKDGVLCSSVNQVVNDMLNEIDHIDKSILAEALSNYYHGNNKSFSGLHIKEENRAAFDEIEDWAIHFYEVD